jgi:hypothetical protein
MAKKITVNPVLVRMKESEKGVIYQSIVAMGIRARQINEQIRKELQERLADVVTTSTDTEETNFDQLLIAREFDNIPKPTVLVMHEVLNSQLDFYFREETQNPQKPAYSKYFFINPKKPNADSFESAFLYTPIQIQFTIRQPKQAKQ